MLRCGALFLLLLLAAAPAAAGTVYKCTGRDGRVSYQGEPCAAGQRQQTLQLSDRQPAAPPPAATVAAVPAENDVPPEAPPPPAPTAPPPTMYRCMRATDGESYLSSNGQPAPYLAPLGVLGVLPSSLAETYSGANHMGQGKVTAGLVANHYTWVQDACRELSPQETCQALHEAWDDNEGKLRRAFQDDEPPLKRRQAELREQLSHCPAGG
jgi:hypothetical protein